LAPAGRTTNPPRYGILNKLLTDPCLPDSFGEVSRSLERHVKLWYAFVHVSFETIYYEMADGEDKFDTFPGSELVSILKSLHIDSLLDIGCGTGAISEALRAIKYTGLDSSKEAIAKARGRHPHSEFVVSDQVPFKRKSFDAVLMYNSLEHFKNPRHILSEAVRVLNSQGHLLILCPNHERLFYYRTLAPRAFRHKPLWWQFGFFLRHVCLWLLRKFGPIIFETSGHCIADDLGIYKKSDDDLRHMVNPNSVTKFLNKQGLVLVIEPVRKRDMWMALFSYAHHPQNEIKT
jgi:ubiquinone/menaquinone biosynthesis C-methylase UbiE